MKATILGAIAAIALAAPGPASAQRTETLFQCTLANGKTVAVTARGDTFTYRYGTPRRAELTLTATPRSGKAFFMQQRYASIQSQLRFTNGAHSYIVHEMGPSRVADSRGVSGLVVMRGNRRIADHSCRRQTEFRDLQRLRTLPEDDEAYSAM